MKRDTKTPPGVRLRLRTSDCPNSGSATARAFQGSTFLRERMCLPSLLDTLKTCLCVLYALAPVPPIAAAPALATVTAPALVYRQCSCTCHCHCSWPGHCPCPCQCPSHSLQKLSAPVIRGRGRPGGRQGALGANISNEGVPYLKIRKPDCGFDDEQQL